MVTVSLVGGGPGDPDLLTLRGEALLARAAIVVVDTALVPLAVAFAPGAVIVAVPDRAPAVDALVTAARGGRSPVVRLYKGDTWLHPAHGAEATALADAGIPSEAVAGVATEMARSAMAGIPVHVRHLAVACTIADAEAEAPPADDPTRTIVVTSDDLAATAATMASTGDASLPAAAIETTGECTRAILGDLAAALAPRRPGVLVTGAVVAVREVART